MFLHVETKKNSQGYALFFYLAFLGSEIVLSLPLGYPQDLQQVRVIRHFKMHKNVKLSLHVSRFVS